MLSQSFGGVLVPGARVKLLFYIRGIEFSSKVLLINKILWSPVEEFDNQPNESTQNLFTKLPKSLNLKAHLVTKIKTIHDCLRQLTFFRFAVLIALRPALITKIPSEHGFLWSQNVFSRQSFKINVVGIVAGSFIVKSAQFLQSHFSQGSAVLAMRINLSVVQKVLSGRIFALSSTVAASESSKVTCELLRY